MKMELANSLSVVIPAYNEAGNLEATIDHILEAAKVLKGELEIIVVNDCSTDGTADLADRLSEKHSTLRVIHNPENLGFGGSYKRGLRDARMFNTVMIPGDDAYPVASLVAIFEKVGRAQIVMTYTTNLEVRPLSRRLISRGFVVFMNVLFGLRLKYYNGVTVLPTAVAQAMRPSDGFSYAAENLVRLIKLRRFTYEQVPSVITERKTGQTKAFSPKNIQAVLSGIGQLWMDVYVRPMPTLPAQEAVHNINYEGKEL
jgi:dolichol-phosphate mannosyltransferase